MAEKMPETYEEAKKELELTVQKLEQGNLSLDESMELFTRGIELSKYCSEKLDSMEGKITAIFAGPDGIPEEKEFVSNE